MPNEKQNIEKVVDAVLANAGLTEPTKVELQKQLTKRQEAKLKREARNLSTLRSADLIAACKEAGIPVTPRQASKWNNGYGAAYRGKFGTA